MYTYLPIEDNSQTANSNNGNSKVKFNVSHKK